jgi:hypothetical protein
MAQRITIEGYAIVSLDGMIADRNRVMPEGLRIEADVRFFTNALDAAAILVHGRHSHEQQAGSDQRRRLIVTDKITKLDPHPRFPNAWNWNPPRVWRVSRGTRKDTGACAGRAWNGSWSRTGAGCRSRRHIGDVATQVKSTRTSGSPQAAALRQWTTADRIDANRDQQDGHPVDGRWQLTQDRYAHQRGDRRSQGDECRSTGGTKKADHASIEQQRDDGGQDSLHDRL